MRQPTVTGTLVTQLPTPISKPPSLASGCCAVVGSFVGRNMYALTQATFGSNRLAAPELSREDRGPPDVIAKGWKQHRGSHWTFDLLDQIFPPDILDGLPRSQHWSVEIASAEDEAMYKPFAAHVLGFYYSILSTMTDITICRDAVSAWNLCRLFVWLPARAQSALQFFVLMASIPHCSIAQSIISRSSMLLSVPQRLKN